MHDPSSWWHHTYRHTFSFFPGTPLVLFLSLHTNCTRPWKSCPTPPPYWTKRNETLSEGILFLTVGRIEMVGRYRRVISVFLFVITAEPRIILAYISSISHFFTSFKLAKSIILPQKSLSKSPSLFHLQSYFLTSAAHHFFTFLTVELPWLDTLLSIIAHLPHCYQKSLSKKNLTMPPLCLKKRPLLPQSFWIQYRMWPWKLY